LERKRRRKFEWRGRWGKRKLRVKWQDGGEEPGREEEGGKWKDRGREGERAGDVTELKGGVGFKGEAGW
jgi:hypothetical protein